MTKLHKKLWLYLIFLGMLGCATNYVPRASSINANMIAEVVNSETVTLINAQSSSEIIEIGSAGMGRSLQGNLQKWTDKAIEVLSNTLGKKGFIVKDDSQKVVKLAITQAHLESVGGIGFRCTVKLNVETGDNQKIEFVGQKASWKYVKSCNKAFTESISVMLADKRIQRYIAE